MLQLWLRFVLAQQYQIELQHKPALTLKFTLMTSAALLWSSGISWLLLHALPNPQQIAALAEQRVHLVPLSYVATAHSPNCSHLAHRKKTTQCANFLLSASGVALVLPISAHSALLDLTFPTHQLSLPMSKLGQVLGPFLVGHRKKIKAQAESLPLGALFTFAIVSPMPVPKLRGHSFAFQSKDKDLDRTAETY